MKIAICSDSHDNLITIDKFLKYCKKTKVETIIHCGDWCAPSTFEVFRKGFKGDIYGVYGNVHADKETIDKMAKKYNIKIEKDKFKIELDKLKIFITHYPDIAKEVAEQKKYDLIFYGHSHTPWMKKIENSYMVNPGTLAGMFSKATFAIYDTKTRKIELKLVERI